jgi:glycosyltransferase involved in cell wall biosynthesis
MIFKKCKSTPSPLIKEVSKEIVRPRWSIMIPTYNCAAFLKKTLESVLSQDLGEELMQIEVVDDCSTKDNPEQVVNEIGKGRVKFYRKPKNEGAIPNFNTCIERSKGELIHILHGDDWVLPGYYSRIENCATKYPETSLFSTRVFYTDEAEIVFKELPRVVDFENQPSKNVNDFWELNPLLFPGVTVRRSAYESLGGFRLDLVHTADWEMWIRVINEYGGMILPEILASYRMFEGNDTSKLAKSAENLNDYLRLSNYFSKYPSFEPDKFMNMVNELAQKQLDMFNRIGDKASVEKNQKFIFKNSSIKDKILLLLKVKSFSKV